MKIVRFEGNAGAQYGVLEGEKIRGLAGSPFADGWSKADPDFDGTEYGKDSVKLLVPCEPTKYLGVGLNFKGAAATLGRPAPTYPITFIKPTGAVVATGENIEIHEKENQNYWFEGELAVVIGKTCKNASKDDAMDCVFGYTCSNDVTDMAEFGHDELKVKGADTFGPVGPCIETDVDPDNCRIRSWLNGEQRQDGNSREFIFDIPYIIEFFSSYQTLFPGDVISMGTPAGAGSFKAGDILKVEVEGIGTLVNEAKAV